MVLPFHNLLCKITPQAHQVTAEVARACAHMVDAITSAPAMQCIISVLAPSRIAARMDTVQKWFPTVLKVDGKIQK